MFSTMSDRQPIVTADECMPILGALKLAPQQIHSWCLQADQDLQRLVRRSLERVLGNNPVGDAEMYERRVWRCLQYHCERQLQDTLLPLRDMWRRLAADWQRNAADPWGIVEDVLLAAALEALVPHAAQVFEQRYGETVRLSALRVAGRSGADLVENFAADLIMPRGDKPPRIHDFQGRTTLSLWLRVVVSHFCLSHFRRRRPERLHESADVASEVCEPQGGHECANLLAPVFRDAISSLEHSDRLLIKLLLLDRVPQHVLAKTQGVHTGNITRRKQRIIGAIWERLRGEQLAHPRSGDVRDCLDAVLAGAEGDLRLELAVQVGEAFRASDGSTHDQEVRP
jgi:RNA polymerase sigma factor (sigma-70 family)